MKRVLFVVLSGIVVAGLTGCACQQGCCPSPGAGISGLVPGTCASCPETCGACAAADDCNVFAGHGICDGCGRGDPARQRGCGLLGRRRAAVDPGPPIGAVTYPYYTLRGPRDFLAGNPAPIGP